MKEKRLQLVTFRQARRLRALGFDYHVDYYYQMSADESVARYRTDEATNVNGWSRDGRISAPSVALALKWFRDKYEENCDAEESALLDEFLSIIEKNEPVH